MATCEVYATDATNRKEPSSSPEHEIAILGLEAQIPAAKQAGLTVQAERLESELAMRRLGLAPLSAEEIQLWRAWLPTAYRVEYLRCECGRTRQKAPFGWGPRPFADYNFDRVPKRVLDLIARMCNECKLGWIEIRTSERAAQDPGLFGGKGNAVALFARWGGSDERLISFEEIRRGLAARGRALTWSRVASGGVLVAAFFAAIGLAMWAPPESNLRAAIWLWAVSAVGLATAAAGIWKRSRVRRAFAYAFR